MRRREFLLTASGATGAAATTSSAAAQTRYPAQDDGNGTPTDGNGTATDGNGTATNGGQQNGGGGGEETVELVNFAFEPGTEEPLYVTPGTTVNFVWVTDTHNIVVDSQPGEAEWEGHEEIQNAGYEYSHTFDVEGEYAFHCQPHVNQGMEGTIIVNQEGAAPGGGGGVVTEVDPEHMGVPIQAHWVGVGAMLGVFGSLVFAFYVLKYGTTPHTGYPEED